MCLSTSSALVCHLKLFARTVRRIFAALPSGSVRHNMPQCKSDIEKRQRRRRRRGVLGVSRFVVLCPVPQTNILTVLGLASLLLLSVPFGQLGRVYPLPCTAKFAELKEFRDTVALVCTLGERGAARGTKAYGRSRTSWFCSESVGCAESEESGEGSRTRV